MGTVSGRGGFDGEKPDFNVRSGVGGEEPEFNGRSGFSGEEPELNGLVKREEETIFAAWNLGFPSFLMIKEQKPAEKKEKKTGNSKSCEKGKI